MSTIPRKNDVLFGKGNSINNHHGNRHFRTLVEDQQQEFLDTKRAEKRRIVVDIMNDIQGLGGRFLWEDPNTKKGKSKKRIRHRMPAEAFTPEGLVTDPYLLDKVWVEVEGDKAMDKVMHRLREKKSSGGQQQQEPRERGELEKERPDTISSSKMNESSDDVSSGNSCAKAVPRKKKMAKDGASPLKSSELGQAMGAVTASLDTLTQGNVPSVNTRPTLLTLPANVATMTLPANVATTTLPANAATTTLPTNVATTAESYLQSVLRQALTTGNAPVLPATSSNVQSVGGLSGANGPGIQPLLRSLASNSVPTRGGSFHATGPVAIQHPALQLPPAHHAPTATNTQTTLQLQAPPTLTMKAPPEGLVRVSIKQWIALADQLRISGDGYLESAVNLARVTTERLVQLVARLEIALPDITLENLGITLDPSPKVHDGILEIEGAQFQTSAQLSEFENRQHIMNTPIFSRAVCAALGNILLEVFSRGQSSSEGRSLIAPACLFDIQLDGSVAPQAQRRRIAVSSGSPISTMVSGLLSVGMPISISQLICDLLEAITEPRPESAYTTLEEVLSDLTRMRDDPEHYLFDRTCPQKALDDTGLFVNADNHLFGREREIKALMDAKKKVLDHVLKKEEAPLSESKAGEVLTFDEMNTFLYELVIFSGYAGAGKSSLLNLLRKACKEEGWFVLNWNYQKSQAPIKVFTKTFDDFFRTWASKKQSGAQSGVQRAMLDSFDQVCQSISSSIDNEGLRQLCEMIPSLSQVFPEIVSARSGDQATSSIEKVGSAKKRFMHTIHVIVKSLCASGRPVLLVHDDLQWANSLDGLKDLILNHVNDSSNIWDTCRKGLLIVGAYRTNEMQDRQDLLANLNSIQQFDKASFTRLAVDELSVDDISELISQKLCLPTRYTKSLARLVHSKTRGNPFFIIQFLKTIIQNGMLEFSVSHRRWTWDCDVIDMQMISDGVAELLISRFNQLPDQLMQAAMVVSCLGSQVEDETLKLLNAGQPLLPFNMQEALQLAVKAGIMDRAGPMYQFTHDIVQQTIYDAIPINQRLFFHKSIGERLLGAAADNPALHSLAVDQINIYAKDAALSSEERSRNATCNAAAARFAISASSFDQARTYVNAGMKMLDADHWEKQYQVSLQLYEMSATVSCYHGDTGTMSSCLTETIANVRSFEDSLTSSIMLAKLLAASSKFDEAVSNCLTVLSSLGEEFPPEIDMPLVVSELSVIQTTLATITVDQVKLLPRMQDKTKLHAMKFMSMLCLYARMSKPLLVPILSCRMVRLTIEAGFCDDSIVGLVTAGYSLFSFTDEIELGYRLGKVAEALIEESLNKNALKTRLCFELECSLKAVCEPAESQLAAFHGMYDAAMLAGDVQTALQIRRLFCTLSFIVGQPLGPLAKHYIACIQQSIKYKQDAVLYSAMSSFHPFLYLSGRSCDEVSPKSFDELNEIGRRSNNRALLYMNHFFKMMCYFWVREYTQVMKLSEEDKPSGGQRPNECQRRFFEGISSSALARQTHQPKWKSVAENSVEKVQKFAVLSQWNFECPFLLLQAELHYVNGDLDAANESYNASIASARECKFIHREALATELYGIFLIENQAVDKGVEQLQMALEGYEKWGAMRKVQEVKEFLELVEVSSTYAKVFTFTS